MCGVTVCLGSSLYTGIPIRSDGIVKPESKDSTMLVPLIVSGLLTWGIFRNADHPIQQLATFITLCFATVALNQMFASQKMVAYMKEIPARDRVGLGVSVLILFFGVYLCTEVVNFKQKGFPADVPCYDLLMALVACAVISCLRVFTFNQVKPLGQKLLPTDKWSTEERAEKLDKFGTVAFKMLYMIISSIAGVYLFGYEGWMPSSLRFGSAETLPLTIKPYEKVPIEMRMYYMVVLGYALHSLVFHLRTKIRNDFFEMFVHHIATVILLVCSYFVGGCQIGVAVQILHDIPDIFVYGAKLFADTRYKATCLTFYFGMVFSWGFLRLYVFPFQIWVSLAKEGFMLNSFNSYGVPGVTGYLITMLMLLQVLHVWWFSLFLLMGYVAATEGKTKDIQANTNSEGSLSELHKLKSVKAAQVAKAAIAAQ